MRAAALLLLAVGLPLTAGASRRAADEAGEKLWAAISVNRLVLDRGGDGVGFMVYFALVNDGEKPVKPALASSHLLVNGEEMKDWALIISNGPRDDRWESLPAGYYLSFGYALGDRFSKPGTYRLVWKGEGFQSPEIEFRVLPSRGK